MNRITAVVAGLLLAFVGTSESFADSNFHYVDLWGDDTNGHGTQGDPWRTIKHAISQCNNADYICLMDSYPDAYEEHNIQILDKKVYIQSCNGNREKVIIDGGGHARVFYINGSATNGTSIRDLTIVNGHTIGDPFNPQWNGGGIWCNSNVAVSNCKIMDCYAYSSGGGIYCVGSSPTITDCLIEGNVAHSGGVGGGGSGYTGGGGILCDSSNPTITRCTIEGNTTPNGFGGGIYCFNNSSPTIKNCNITGNTTTVAGGGGGCGGGISCRHLSSPTIKNCNISDNTAVDNGGGIYCANGIPTISGCTISGNTSASQGGGIYCYDNSSPTIRTPTISGGSVCGNYPNQIEGNPGSWPTFVPPETHVADHCPGPAGDMDNDGDVDADDLNALHDALGIELTDVNNNGCVDIDDLLYVIEDWGEGCTP